MSDKATLGMSWIKFSYKFSACTQDWIVCCHNVAQTHEDTGEC